MKRRLEVQDVLEVLKDRTVDANEQEVEIILSIVHIIKKVCAERGNKNQRQIIQDCIRDIELQKRYNLLH